MTKLTKTRFAGMALVCLGATLPSAASATEGYFAMAYGTAQRGVAGAGIAYSQDAMSSAINPASVATVGRELTLGVEIFSPRREFTVSGGNPGLLPDGTTQSGRDWFVVPNVAFNMPLANGAVVNFSAYGNGGMNTAYRDVPNANCGPFSGVFCGGTAGVDLTQLFLSVGYAKKTGNFSWGVAPTVAVQRFSAKGLAPFGALSVDPANLSNRGHDMSYGIGLRAGFQYEINPQLTIGVTGQTKFKMSKFKKYAGLFENGGEFDIPATLGVGLAFKPRSDITLMLDYQRIFYSNVPAVANSTTATALFGSKGGSGFGWDDVDVIRIGAEWQQSPDMTWRAGYAHATNPVGPEDVTFNVLAPGIVKHHLSFGGTKRLNDRDKLDFSLAYVVPQTVSGPEMTPGGPSGNTVKLRMEQFSVSVGWTRTF